MADKRIIELTNEAMNHSNDDYLAVDSSSSGTRKIKADALLAGVAKQADLAAETAARKQDVADLKADITSLENGKANVDGYYEDLVSGGTTQLLSDMVETDTTPYNYRTAGGSLEIGDRMKLKKIVGGSLAVNQIMPIVSESKTTSLNGVNLIDNRDGSYSFTTDANGATTNTLITIITKNDGVIRGHNYFIGGLPKGTAFGTYEIVDGYNGVLDYSFDKEAVVCKAPLSSSSSTARLDLRLQVYSGTIVTTPVTFKPYIIDLTAMFGTTIADYIYSLETATAGAGVAWLKSHFPRIFDAGYIPYNAGTLEHVSGLSEHKMVGFNQWDEEWEVYGASQIRSKNRIPVLPGLTYYTKTPSVGISLYFKAQINDTANVGSVSVANNTFAVPTNAHYAVMYTNTGYGTVYKNDICINLSWSGWRNGEYEAYDKHSYPLDSSLTLRGIPKVDSAGNMYYDGDIYSPDGTVTRRYGIVDLGTLSSWSRMSESYQFGTFSASYSGMRYDTRVNTFVCSKYEASNSSAVSASSDNVIWNRSGNIVVKDTSKASMTAADFKAAMSGVMLVYELATPTTEEATPYRQLQICDHNGTEEFVSTGIVPVGHETRYPDNLRAKIEGLPWDFSSLIAPTEKTTTASRNYTAGSLLIMGNVLYKVTANIANGGNITVGTNVTATTLAEVIAALS